ncbi:WXG100 family type VII secretion target [Microbacterium sp. PRF11]|jgi:WXG100 family type VII secretion target|uniref:WXG100 family type VII secretion target n=1 Tax=Microbacterium sp. PRF11 TaxID=2962593 RepID=UPI0025D7B4CE|nr:WXG100 family type VII secretion target [Microbacterium sp. PRF11]MDT0116867.1 WXG100 family type VII secretion target [Microbacterium sp. PRF11]
MTDRISAEEGALARGSQAVNGAHADIADSTRRVLAELDELQGRWVGEAATSYGVLVNEWTAGANRLNDVLLTLSAALQATARDQAAVEDAHRTTISGLDSLLGGQ